MRKIILLLVALPGLVACNQSKTSQQTTAQADTAARTAALPTPSVPASKLIVPGKSIGQTAINDNGAEVVQRLGRPDAGDAAMGKSLSIWYANHDSTGHETMIYSSRQMGTTDETSKVKQIRITSPWFVTVQGLHAGSSLQQIEQVYELQKTAYFTKKGKQYTIYQAPGGIAFELDWQNVCRGIIVFDKDTRPGSNYLPFYDNLNLVKN